MRVEDLLRKIADASDLAVILTDADTAAPGPAILYVNPAFSRLTGYQPHEVIGQSPRMLQGTRTNKLALRKLARALRDRAPFSGTFVNYRKTGEEYLCRIEIAPLFNRAGEVEHFVAFEREVKRRRGRPAKGGLGRFVEVER